MPFDSMPTKPDVFSLEGLIAWLETQDPATEYNYGDTRNCLYCQYFRAVGLVFDSVGGVDYVDGDGIRRSLGVFATATIESEYPRTFGAALDRARALQQGRA